MAQLHPCRDHERTKGWHGLFRIQGLVTKGRGYGGLVECSSNSTQGEGGSQGFQNSKLVNEEESRKLRKARDDGDREEKGSQISYDSGDHHKKELLEGAMLATSGKSGAPDYSLLRMVLEKGPLGLKGLEAQKKGGLISGLM
ncbi:hypothetical protein ACFE04_000859 [Oxalis oulophora]